jgi:hypothetical protein
MNDNDTIDTVIQCVMIGSGITLIARGGFWANLGGVVLLVLGLDWRYRHETK